jgi:hypothetical protein
MYNRVVIYRFASLILNGVRRLEQRPFLIDFVPTTIFVALEKATALQNATYNFLQKGFLLERIGGGKVLVAILIYQFCVAIEARRTKKVRTLDTTMVTQQPPPQDKCNLPAKQALPGWV